MTAFSFVHLHAFERWQCIAGVECLLNKLRSLAFSNAFGLMHLLEFSLFSRLCCLLVRLD